MISCEALREIVACFFLLAGAVVFLGSAIGMLRLPDFYSRIHASGNSETMGTLLAMIGLIILEGPTLTAAKIAFVFLFVALGNPIGSHILSKAAYKSGHPIWTVDSVRESEADRALNVEHFTSEPLGNLDEEELAELKQLREQEQREEEEKERARRSGNAHKRFYRNHGSARNNNNRRSNPKPKQSNHSGNHHNNRNRKEGK